MKKLYISSLLLLSLSVAFATRFAGEIFQISPGVMNQAMGSTGLTDSRSLASGWWNPALLSAPGSRGLELMRSEHFAGLLEQNQASLILGKNRSSIIINHLAINNIKLTQLEDPADSLSNDNRPVIWKTVGNNDIIVHGAISRDLNPKLALGFAPKLAYRKLAEHSGYAFGADLGLFYQMTDQLATAANLRDFFSTTVIWENGTYEVVIPNLDLEAAYVLHPLGRSLPLRVAARAQIYAEDRGEASMLQAGVFSADFHAGLSLAPIPPLMIMAGYDIDSITAGIAVNYKQFGLNYAFRDKAPDGLGSSQRMSLSYSW
ncbi:MAG TPA: hypothetical protein P5533_07080 [Candidatus Cloacimonadota bacterium]|nr:hypothetical protein [Candidatus Cloacimonadota bacterium]